MKNRNSFKVGKSYRTNHLSTTAGGTTLLVEMETQNDLSEYTNIKYVDAYMKKLITDPKVTRVWEKGENGNVDILIYSQ